MTLWPFGGIASMEQMPEKPSQEPVVALAGPAVNVIIAAVLLLWLDTLLEPQNLVEIDILGRRRQHHSRAVQHDPRLSHGWRAVLRALLAMGLGNARGTELAATIGHAFAVDPMLLILRSLSFSPRQARRPKRSSAPWRKGRSSAL
jgi:hypothetical protein